MTLLDAGEIANLQLRKRDNRNRYHVQRLVECSRYVLKGSHNVSTGTGCGGPAVDV